MVTRLEGEDGAACGATLKAPPQGCFLRGASNGDLVVACRERHIDITFHGRPLEDGRFTCLAGQHYSSVLDVPARVVESDASDEGQSQAGAVQVDAEVESQDVDFETFLQADIHAQQAQKRGLYAASGR